MVKAFVTLAHFLARQGFQSKFHVLDNESRAELKRKIKGIGFIYTLVPSNLILEDIIEQEIQTFNDHFVLGLIISHTNFTLKLWCHVIPQAKVTLNMLYPPRLHHQLFFQFHIER